MNTAGKKQDSINLLLLNDGFGLGGAENQILLYMYYLPLHKYRIHFGYFIPGNELIRKIPSNVKVGYLRRERAFDIKAIFKLRRYITENAIDIVHSHGFIDSIYAVLATLFTGKTRIMTVHGYYTGRHMMIYRLISMYFNCIIAVSSPLKEYLVNKGMRERKLAVIRNGVDLKQFSMGNSRKIEKEREMVFGMIARFQEYKDHLTVCRAVKMLKDKGAPVKAALWGRFDNDYSKTVQLYVAENRLEECIDICGETDNVKEAFSRMDVFIAPSVNETFDITLVEAMASRKAVIASDIAAHTQILHDGEYGLIYKRKDEIDLMNKMCRFIKDKNEILLFAEKAYERAKAYDIHPVIDLLCKVYDAAYN